MNWSELQKVFCITGVFLCGILNDVKCLIYFESKFAVEFIDKFHEAVDEYVKFCKVEEGYIR